MIAEPESEARTSIERVLVAENYEVESVTDGRELLEKLETTKPDLLLFDMVMPKLDGMAVLARLKETGRDLPVIVLSGGTTSDLHEVLRAGAANYITKPVDLQEVLYRVRSVLDGLQRRMVPPFTLEVPLRELHDPESGRIDARRVAEFLGVPSSKVAEALSVQYQTLHKTPAAQSLQKGLGPIKRSIELVSRVTRSPSDARIWLNNPHPDLGGQTPLEVILSGKATAIVALLENALAGIPS